MSTVMIRDMATEHDVDSFSQVEAFLAGDDGGLLRKWAVDGFQRRLKDVVKVNGLALGTVRQRSPGCLEFRLHFPRQRLPSRKLKLRVTLHALFRQAGYRVPGRALWYRVGTRQRNVVKVYAAPAWRCEQ